MNLPVKRFFCHFNAENSFATDLCRTIMTLVISSMSVALFLIEHDIQMPGSFCEECDALKKISSYSNGTYE